MRTPAGAVLGKAYVCVAAPPALAGLFWDIAIGSEVEELPPPPQAESIKNAAAANPRDARIAIAFTPFSLSRGN
jgi:hypothetical protein